MPEPSTQVQLPTTWLDLAKLFVNQYGNHTFGVATVVVMFFVIFKPMLETNQQAIRDQREVLETVRKHEESLRNCVLHAQTTVEILDRLLIREQVK